MGFIIRKLIEIDKLKIILMNEEQRKLFDYLPKPTIPLESNLIKDEIFAYYFKKEKNFEEKVIEALDAYKISKLNTDPINIKLLSLMDKEIKDVFESAICKLFN